MIGKDKRGRFIKGNPYGERFKKGHKIHLGNIQTQETKDKISKSQIKRLKDHPEIKERIYTNKDRNKKISLSKMGDLNPSKRPEVREKQREIRNRQILELGGGPNIGKDETQILDELELSLGYKIERQYSVCGYFTDGYIPELNLVIEIDEHPKIKERDIRRQNEIKSKLNCSFIRIPTYIINVEGLREIK